MAMNNGAYRIIPSVILGLIVCAMVLSGQQSSNLPVAVATSIIKSVFVNGPERGIDPFFPDLRAALKDTLKQNEESSPATTTTSSVDELFSLKGIIYSGGKRVALINNQVFQTGQSLAVKTRNGVAVIRCVDIKKNSVSIEIMGSKEIKELRIK
jgi:hypothetical protein